MSLSPPGRGPMCALPNSKYIGTPESRVERRAGKTGWREAPAGDPRDVREDNRRVFASTATSWDC